MYQDSLCPRVTERDPRSISCCSKTTKPKHVIEGQRHSVLVRYRGWFVFQTNPCRLKSRSQKPHYAHPTANKNIVKRESRSNRLHLRNPSVSPRLHGCQVTLSLPPRHSSAFPLKIKTSYHCPYSFLFLSLLVHLKPPFKGTSHPKSTRPSSLLLFPFSLCSSVGKTHTHTDTLTATLSGRTNTAGDGTISFGGEPSFQVPHQRIKPNCHIFSC